ncbi:MAG: GGDEF domain-containing protein [Caloramator sp.]|nr:GGDEF domain-containing protein [Caloramator sp.]
MKDKIYLTELILIADENCNVIMVLFDRNQNFRYKNIKEIIDVHSKENFECFWDAIIYKEQATDYLIGINIDGIYSSCFFSGIKCDKNILILVLNDLSESLSEELMKINNEQLNALRMAIKEISEKNKTTISNEQQLLNDMISLNNELVNMQRELTKKNIQLKILNEKLQEMSIKDQLTGLFNRRYFYNKIKEEITRAKRGNYKLSIISVDLNNFKKVNDTLGHSEGDRLLKEFARIALSNTRAEIDSVYRFGGDEFIILLVDCDFEGARKIAERLNESIKKVNDIVSLSYGIVELDLTTDINIEDILILADKRMYEHKKIQKGER